MKITKNIKGERYDFYVQLVPNKQSALVKYFKSDIWTTCEISDDFNYIVLPEGFFRFDDTDVVRLKFNKVQKIEALEYNGILNYGLLN